MPIKLGPETHFYAILVEIGSVYIVKMVATYRQTFSKNHILSLYNIIKYIIFSLLFKFKNGTIHPVLSGH